MRRILYFFALSFGFSIITNAQCISGDCQNGTGTFVFQSGTKYVGSFADGEINGTGICYYTDGSKYSGEWQGRLPNGKGTKTYIDGSTHTGWWKQGLPVDQGGTVMQQVLTSKGEYAFDEYDIQTGCLFGDCMNGAGLFAYADGSKYEGEFRNGALNGEGTFYYPDGKKYTGSFQNNYSHGEGTLFQINGSKISGLWEHGEFKGTLYSNNTNQSEGCISGNCRNGQGTYVYKSRTAKYEGTFRNGKPSGQGTCYFANGEKYFGQWSDGMFNGVGTLTLRDGRKVMGNWVNGTFKGKQRNYSKPQTKPTPPRSNSLVNSNSNTTALDKANKVNVYAVVIGVSTYSHMPVLKYTDDDAYRIYAFLKSPEGGAIPDENIKILIDEDATKGNIKNAMSETFMKADQNDLILLYFSGHGLQGSFLPIDFDGFNNKLFHEEITSILEMSPAKYKLLIADACHSGGLLAAKGSIENILSSYYTSLANANPGTALIMSSKSDETSLESSGLRQGVFSHFLIRGLKGEADSNGNSIVTVDELFNFIYHNVRSYTVKRQSPVLKGDFDRQMTVSVVKNR